MKRKGIQKTDLTACCDRRFAGGARAADLGPEKSKQEWFGVQMVLGGGVEPQGLKPGRF